MPLEDRLGLYDDDGLSPCWEQGGGEEKAEPVAKPKAWPAGATSEHAELVAEGGVFDHELASRAAAEVGGDLEWFHGCRKRRKPGPEAAGEGENGRGDGGDCHGMGSTTKVVAGPGSQAWAIHMISLEIWKVASKGISVARQLAEL